MSKIFPLVLGAALCCGSIIGCNTKVVDAPLGDWQLVFFEKQGVAQQLCQSTLSISLDQDYLVFSGFSGINNYSGKIERNNDKLTTNGDFISTRMAGPKEAMNFEMNYLQVLSNASNYELTTEDGKKTLIIYSKDQNAFLKFQQFSLVGSKWNLSAVNSENGTISVYENGKENMPFIYFDKENATGFTGVNSLQLNYTLDESAHKLTFTPGAVTLSVSGDENINMIEALYLAALGQCTKYTISGNTLTLYNAQDEFILAFDKQPLVK